MKTLFLLLAVSIFSVACQKTDLSNDVAELMKLHSQQREAHFSKNARLMVDQSSDNFITLNRGKIDTVFSREEDINRFQHYFDAVEFKKWDDVIPPKIKFSDDHSMAYMIVDKIVVLETKDTAANRIEESVHFSWVNIFRKQKTGEWKSECVVSTNEPEVVKILQ